MPENDDQQNGDAGNSGNAEGDKKPTTPEPKPITFKSQEDLDAIIEARVARAKPKDYDDLVALKARVDAEAEEKKTELQKEKDARTQAETAAAEKISKANAKLIRAELLKEAAAQGAVDADVVVQLLAG